MEIKQGFNKFYIGESEDRIIAEITYRPQGNNTIIADHTYVSKELRGQNTGKKLVEVLVNWARQEQKKIYPLCSFVKVEMTRNPEYTDLLAD